MCEESQKAMRGCNNEAPIPLFELDGVQYKRCPYKLVTIRSMKYVQFWNYMKQGFLPNQLPMLLQPNKFLEAVSALNNAYAEDTEKE